MQKKFYISSLQGTSGICRYSADFYEFVLREQGYLFLPSNEALTTIFTQISSKDIVHLEIGIFQSKEIEILLLMLQANYKHVTVTLHDAPLLKYPLRQFKNPLLNLLSKGYDRYISRFQNTKPLIQKIEKIYVLNKRGLEIARNIYHTENFHYLPHVVNIQEKMTAPAEAGMNLMYLGFIGRNKGIDYSLKLHRKLIEEHPDTQFYIVGTAMGKELKFYDSLKEKYIRNVHFMGYLSEEKLNEVFRKSRFAILLFEDYGFYSPVSGSILSCMSRGKIVMTNKVNAIPEIISESKTGVFLNGNLKEDLRKINEVFKDQDLQEAIIERATEYLKNTHRSDVVLTHMSVPVHG